MILFLSASLIFCKTTCLATEIATLPKSLGVTSVSIVSPISNVLSIFLASLNFISVSGLKNEIVSFSSYTSPSSPSAFSSSTSSDLVSISSSSASTTGAVAATAEPPQILEPTPISVAVFELTFNIL